MSIGHDHSSEGIEGQGHRLRSRSWGQANVAVLTSIEGSLFSSYNSTYNSVTFFGDIDIFGIDLLSLLLPTSSVVQV